MTSSLQRFLYTSIETHTQTYKHTHKECCISFLVSFDGLTIYGLTIVHHRLVHFSNNERIKIFSSCPLTEMTKFITSFFNQSRPDTQHEIIKLSIVFSIVHNMFNPRSSQFSFTSEERQHNIFKETLPKRWKCSIFIMQH